MRYQAYRESQPHHNVQFALQLLVIAFVCVCGGGGGRLPLNCYNS